MSILFKILVFSTDIKCNIWQNLNFFYHTELSGRLSDAKNYVSEDNILIIDFPV